MSSSALVGGMALTEVADEFSTPTYVIDEADFRHRIRRYRGRCRRLAWPMQEGAATCTAVAQSVVEEEVALVCTHSRRARDRAIRGRAIRQIVVHGMATSPSELCKAANVGVGQIVVDSPIEVAALATRVRRLKLFKSAGAWFRAHRRAVRHTIQPGTRWPMFDCVGLSAISVSTRDRRFALRRSHPTVVPLMAEIRARHAVILTELKSVADKASLRVGDPELITMCSGLRRRCARRVVCSRTFSRPTVDVGPPAISARAVSR